MLLPVVAVTLLACNSCILANGNSHLRKRLNILESKVSLDSIEFREGIERLTSSLNRTCDCNDKQTNTDGTNSPQVDADIKEMLLVAERVRRGFYNEKKFLRQTLSEISDKVDEQIKACEETYSNALATTRTQIGALEQSLIDNLKACKKTNSNTLATSKSQIGALEQRMNDRYTNLEKKLNHVEELVTLKNEQLKQQLLNMETEMTNINERDKATKQQIANLEMVLIRSHCPLNTDLVHGNSCYKLVKMEATWSEAVKECARMSSYLVEVDDQPEQDFLESIMKENDVYATWLGASFVESERQVVWKHSGRPVADGYTPWHASVPVNARLHICLYMTLFGSSHGYGRLCHSTLAYICEGKLG